MPRYVRNYWVETVIDGRATALEGGPRSKEGGIYVTVKMRDAGGIITALGIVGHARSDGTLTLRVENGRGEPIHEMTTKR